MFKLDGGDVSASSISDMGNWFLKVVMMFSAGVDEKDPG